MVRARPSSSEGDTTAVRVRDADGQSVAALAVMRFLGDQIRHQKSNHRYFLNNCVDTFAPVAVLALVPRKSLSQSHHRFSMNAADT